MPNPAASTSPYKPEIGHSIPTVSPIKNAAPALTLHRDAIDVCDVLSSFSSQEKGISG